MKSCQRHVGEAEHEARIETSHATELLADTRVQICNGGGTWMGSLHARTKGKMWVNKGEPPPQSAWLNAR
eukprot:scaffold24_cov341-Pavlova_lutheri.AAC.95